MLWSDLRGRPKAEHQELQNLDPTSSPHLEEISFGGIVDLDLLSCFPKNGQESLEGRVGIKLSRFTTMEEREEKKLCWKNGEEAPFIGGHKKWPLGQKMPQSDSPARGRPAPRPGRQASQASIQRREAAGDPATARPGPAREARKV